MIRVIGLTLALPGLTAWLVGLGVSVWLLLLLGLSHLGQRLAAQSGGTTLARLGLVVEGLVRRWPGLGERWYGRWAHRLHVAGIPLRPAELISIAVGLGLVTGLLFGWLLGYAVLALFVGLVATRLPFLYVSHRANRQLALMTRQIERLCITLAKEAESGADSGRLLNRAAHAKAPLGPLFQAALDERNRGVTPADALEHLVARLHLPQLERLIRPLLAHLRDGAQLAPLLQAAADEIRMEDELVVQLSTQLAQPRVQFWMVVLLSIPMLFVLHWGDPQAVNILLGTPLVFGYLLLWGFAFSLYGIVHQRTTLKSLYRSVA